MVMDSGNERVRELIARWRRLSLSQKDLSLRLHVHEATISHIANDPMRAVSTEVVDHLEAIVESEEATRVDALPLTVEAFCDSQGLAADSTMREKTVNAVRAAIKNPGHSIQLPAGVGAALLRVGGPNSQLFLIALKPGESNDERRALAHELQHLHDLVLRSVKPARKPPRGSY